MPQQGWRSSAGGAAAVALLLTACGQASAPATSERPLTQVTAAYSNITGDNIPSWVAMKAGIFKKNGLDVDLKLISGGAATMAALLSDGIQIGQLGGAEALSATAQGADLVVVATLAPVFPYVFMVPESIKVAADLKGKKVGVSSRGGSADIATQLVLRGANLDPNRDVTIVAVGSHANRTAALASGAIQGAVDDPPDSVELLEKGFHVLFDLAKQKLPAAQTVVMAKRAWVEGHKDVVQRYVDSLVQAMVKAKKEKAFTVGVLKTYFNRDNEHAMTVAYDFFVGEVLPILPYPEKVQFDEAQKVLGAKTPKVLTVDVGKLIDRSYVQSAANRKLDR
jgi:NitT/TauT family transport system substrate-binding protein